MSTVRLRRLQADFQNVQHYVSHHPRVQLIQTEGTPPERYQFQYQIKSLRQKDERLLTTETHLVEISLPRNYPRVPPQCRMLTPIFHPNIAPHAICIGDHWSAGESLASIIARIGELIAYQSYNTKSPLNGEAARWTSENLDQLPLDPVSMVVEDAAAPPPPPPNPPTPTPTESVPLAAPVTVVEVRCSQCNALLRIPAHLRGRKFRCPRCQTVGAVPAEEASQ